MQPGAATWMSAALVTTAVSLVASSHTAAAQEFKIPVSVSHFVYRPGDDLALIEELRGWTFGLGLTIVVREAYTDRQRGIYGVVAQATYGGPYWYLSGGAGIWNSGSPSYDEVGFGLYYHYNVFQSRDFRTRVGPAFGWSTARVDNARTHAFTYRAMVSRAVSSSLSFYAGLGAETDRRSSGGNTANSTSPGLVGGVYARLGQRYGFSTGIETLLTDPLTLTFASSVQFQPAFDSKSSIIP